ncbi:cilia- and flagella-associated protein 298 isoform X2 [Ranitomeya variabilis]|uniref:cilia- and flagella-associated protein 298 isoform X2 n=1 Tax=Ranitomeya variabilis TaxID=490064 RepID=UPI004055E527
MLIVVSVETCSGSSVCSSPQARQELGTAEMVRLHVKHGDESQFLFDTTVDAPVNLLVEQVTSIYNGRLKVSRICAAPNENMKKVLQKTIEEAKALISKKQAEANICVTMDVVKDALDQLRGAVMIVYPMGLPPHDPIRMEFENNEDLSGTQAGQMVIEEDAAQLWWAGKELLREQKLADYVGKNEKTKIIVKIQKKGHGAPAREPVISEEEQKNMMMYYHRRQEELKKLEEDEDISYLNAEWADSSSLKRQFQGVKDIKWRLK